MRVAVLLSVLMLAGGIAFAQETNAPVANNPVVIADVQKAPEPLKISGLMRLHYDISFLSNVNAQSWGNFSFYYLTLKGVANIADNLKAEASVDLGTFSGQRNLTNSAMMVEKLIETAYMQYKIDPMLVITAGRMWEYYTPLVFSQMSRDGVSVSGSVLGGLLKYGVQVFNDSVQYSPYFPLMEAQLGVTPLKGLTLDGAVQYSGKADSKKTGLSLNLYVKKMDMLPDLNILHEFSFMFSTNNTSGVTKYDDYTLIGWQFGTIMPFAELFVGDANTDPAVTNDVYVYARFAAKWDVTPNFAVVPYLRYDFLKSGSSSAPADTVSFRLRLDCKF